jgi:hypothetical protein
VDPKVNKTLSFDFELLSSRQFNAADNVPAEFSHALYLINEMSMDDKLGSLVDAARKNNIPLVNNKTPAAIAAEIWLSNPDVLENLHAEILASKPKSFEHFQSNKTPLTNFTMPSSGIVSEIQNDLNSWFVEHRCGMGCKVILFDHGSKLCFLIKHGKPLRKDGSLNNGDILYRAESYDVLVYDHTENELAINPNITKDEKVLYLEVIGYHLFGDPEYFLSENKYSLEALMLDGESSLICSDIDGIESIKLTQVKRFIGGSYGDKETIDTKDYFASKSWGGEFVHIVSATFSIFFTGAKRARTVRIVPPNKAIFERDDDSILVERWLKARGFILMPSNRMGIYREKPHEADISEAVGCN